MSTAPLSTAPLFTAPLSFKSSLPPLIIVHHQCSSLADSGSNFPGFPTTLPDPFDARCLSS
ncbi:hypothetical protein CPC08DRAFT_710930, partial [Agrocybe pediades]